MKNAPRILLAIAIITAGTAHAAVLSPTDVSVWLRKSANGVGNGNELNMIDPTKTNAPNAASMNMPDANDPSTWTTNPQWQSDWQGPNFAVTATNGSKVLTGNAWIVFDLGSSRNDLDEMFIWNVAEGTGWSRGIQDFNLHYASSPSALPTGWAGSGNLNSTATEYAFGTGWTQHVTSYKLDKGSNQNQSGTTNNGSYGYDGRIDVSGITTRYIGIEILSNWGDANGRAGLNNVTLTTIDLVPEPSSAVLIALGSLTLLLRRRP